MFFIWNCTFVCLGKPETVKLNQLACLFVQQDLPLQSGAVLITYYISFRKIREKY